MSNAASVHQKCSNVVMCFGLAVRLPLLLSIMPAPVMRSMISKLVLSSEQGKSFACSPGLFYVFQFPPSVQKHARRQIGDDAKLSLGVRVCMVV